jgi:transcriptional regulator of acetoin/glycerol metabolism
VLETALFEATNGVIRASDIGILNGVDTPPSLQPVLEIESLSLDSVIRHHVQAVLELNHGNKLRSARQLGISRSTLYRILANETILAR